MAFDQFDIQLMLERFRSGYGAADAQLQLRPGQDPEFTLTVAFPDGRPNVVVYAHEAEEAERKAVALIEKGSSGAQ